MTVLPQRLGVTRGRSSDPSPSAMGLIKHSRIKKKSLGNRPAAREAHHAEARSEVSRKNCRHNRSRARVLGRTVQPQRLGVNIAGQESRRKRMKWRACGAN